MPAEWPTASVTRTADGKTSLAQDGWNTQHNSEGKLENQFQVSVNRETQEITFDFKGSDAWSNWKSDLGNAGAAEFAKIQAKAQAAYEYLKDNPDYKDYRFATTGHSLGGGMAQSFALKNNLDAYVYNSLPIARGTIEGGYFKDAGGYEAALARYQATHRQVHDVRTPNDIATYFYGGVKQDQYLSQHVPPGPTMLPGSSLPTPLKTVLMASGSGTLVAGSVMAADHANKALVDGQQGLSVDKNGRYIIPEGHADFAQLPPEARKLFARLSESPVVKAICSETRGPSSPCDRFVVTREDGSRQYISVDSSNGGIEINHYGNDGRHTLIEMNERQHRPARVTEFDAQGKSVSTETVALRAEESGTRTAAKSLSPEQQAQFVMAWRQTGDRLRDSGLSTAEVGQVCAAAVGHCARHEDKGPPEQFLVSRDGQRLGVMHPGRQLSEMDIPQALRRSTEEHLAAASQSSTAPADTLERTAAQSAPAAPKAAEQTSAPALG
ncbi:hypothetical protein [Hydrogenophaga sp. MI9]|uniref:hypothetical protein n=1 Tax=Hydrogenophaga sp. MI9 TaxID=3453719 RepID=UPI003EE8FED9